MEVLDVNPCYARVKYASGREDNVALKHIAPCSNSSQPVTDNSYPSEPNVTEAESHYSANHEQMNTVDLPVNEPLSVNDKNTLFAELFSSDDENEEFLGFRRSARIKNKTAVNYKE